MKIAIYTVITGNYDELRQPVSINDKMDYICFSNEYPDKRIGIWEIRKIPVVVNDVQRLSRYPKIKPFEVLDEYDYTVYMDANLVIAKPGFYKYIFDLIEQNQLLSGVKNGWRDCIYEEGFRCILSKLDSPKKILSEMSFLKKECFPKKYGMYEANIIFRKHMHPKVIRQSKLWWDLVQKYAKRDQLCFSYTLWKNDLPWSYIFPDGSNTHNNDNIVFNEHPHKRIVQKKKSLRKIAKFSKPVLYLFYNLSIRFNLNKIGKN